MYLNKFLIAMYMLSIKSMFNVVVILTSLEHSDDNI